MSSIGAKRCFEENVRLFANPHTEPEEIQSLQWASTASRCHERFDKLRRAAKTRSPENQKQFEIVG